MKKERHSFRMRVDEAFFADLANLRRREHDVPDNTEMIRRLISRALASSGGANVTKVITKK